MSTHTPPDPGGSSILPAASAAAVGAAAQNPMSPDASSAGTLGTTAGLINANMIGGLVGTADYKAIADRLNPAKEHAHWRYVFKKRGDVDRMTHNYDEHYGPAYQYGWEAFAREYNHRGGDAHTFDQAEHHLGKEWNKHRDDHELTWEQAKSSAHESYNRAYLILSDK